MWTFLCLKEEFMLRSPRRCTVHCLETFLLDCCIQLYQVADHMNGSVCTPVVDCGILSHHQSPMLTLRQIANSYWNQTTSNCSDAASASNRYWFECFWMQCCQQNHGRSVYVRLRDIPTSRSPVDRCLEVNLCRVTSVSIVSSTLDYNNRKTLIIIITISNYYYYYYKNNNNNDHFIHSHFTEVKIKQVSAQCWAVVWVPQG